MLIGLPIVAIQSHHYTLSLNNIFLDFLCTNTLIQMVDVPTRVANSLDVFVTNRPCLVEEYNTISGISDHDAVLVAFVAVAQLHHPPKRSIYLWAQVDLNLIRQQLNLSVKNLQIHMYTSS